jgi:hypothetical protein
VDSSGGVRLLALARLQGVPDLQDALALSLHCHLQTLAVPHCCPACCCCPSLPPCTHAQGYPWVLGRNEVAAGQVITITTRPDAVASESVLPIM